MRERRPNLHDIHTIRRVQKGVLTIVRIHIGAHERGRVRVRHVVLACLLVPTGLTMLCWFVWRSADPLAQARDAARANNWGAAFASARQRLALEPGDTDALALAAHALFQLQEFEQAEDFARQIPIEMYPHDELRARGEFLTHLGWWPPAIQVARELLRREPQDPRLLERLAVLQFQNGNLIDARASALQATHLADRAASAYCILGVIDETLGEPEDAIRAFRKVIELDSTGKSLPVSITTVRFKLARNLVRVNSLGEGCAILESLVSQSPSPEFMAELGEVHFRLGNTVDSRRHWAAALQLDPKQPVAAIGLARLDLLDGRPAQAVERLEQLLAQDLAFQELHHTLSQAYARLGNRKQSEKHRDLADAMRRDNEAEQAQNRALFQSPIESDVAMRRAEQAMVNGQLGEAEMYLREASRMTPHHPRIATLSQQLRALRSSLQEKSTRR